MLRSYPRVDTPSRMRSTTRSGSGSNSRKASTVGSFASRPSVLRTRGRSTTMRWPPNGSSLRVVPQWWCVPLVAVPPLRTGQRLCIGAEQIIERVEPTLMHPRHQVLARGHHPGDHRQQHLHQRRRRQRRHALRLLPSLPLCSLPHGGFLLVEVRVLADRFSPVWNPPLLNSQVQHSEGQRLHRSKGLEAESCVLVGDCVYDGEFPFRNLVYELAGFPASYDRSQRDEAKRLAYVAMTRAKGEYIWFAEPSAVDSAFQEAQRTRRR